MDIKYIYLLAGQLEGFTKTGDNVFNCRCPYCLDSKIRKSKKRGYIYEANGVFRYYCHNCHQSNSFKYFLKDQNETLYHEYLAEIVADKKAYTPPKSPKTVKKFSIDPLSRLPRISRLSPFHPAKKYIVSRQIPTNFHHDLYLTSRFRHFTNTLLPGKFDDSGSDEERIIIPIYHGGELVAYQGRCIGNASKIRYITVVLNETINPLIYGNDRIDWSSRHYLVEGPIDSMYLPNCAAGMGSDLYKIPGNRQSVYVYDNEPRNKDIVDSMRRTITMGKTVCVWPDTVKQKDIGDMILKLVPPGDYVQTEDVRQAGWRIRTLIDRHSHRGLAAELALAKWSRV